MSTTTAILQVIRDCGYAASVHHLGDYVEAHAVPLDGQGPVRIARCDQDDEEGEYRAACELAGMVEIDLE